MLRTLTNRSLALGLALLALPLTTTACRDDVPEDGTSSVRTDGQGESLAFRITRREQLVGGRRALGETGDYMLQNDAVRVVIQDLGFSRGFGIFGGGIIDMDLRRLDESSNLQGSSGQDMFGETFPAFFLQALEPEKVEIVNDGTDGTAAHIRVSGYAGDFLTLIKGLNDRLIEVFDGHPEGQVSGVSCQLGRFDGQVCSPEDLDGTLVKRCAAPGGLICSAQCQLEDRTNLNGDVIGKKYRLPNSDVPCNPGVYEPESCLCVNDGERIPVDDEDRPDLTRVDEVCDYAGDFCDPGCPDTGVLALANGETLACERGIFDPGSCACQPVAGGGSGTMCLPYCPGGEQTPTMDFYVDYFLPPGVNYVKVTAGLRNTSSSRADFPVDPLVAALLGSDFAVPMGDVHLFSAGNKIFAPGAGFDLRGNFDTVYANPPELPALPGFAVDFLATVTGRGVSYGVMIEPDPRNFGNVYKDNYAAVGAEPNERSMIVPFSFSAFVGAFTKTLPERLNPGENFEFTRYFMVGTGDVGSVVDIMYQIREREFGESVPLGRIEGHVVDGDVRSPVDDAWVIVYRRIDGDGCAEQDGDYDADGRLARERFQIFSQYTTRNGGRFGGNLEAGCYAWRTSGPERDLGTPTFFEVREGTTTTDVLVLPPSGRLDVLVVDAQGHPLPAKVTVVGFYGEENIGKAPWDFLFDLSAGEPWRNTDLVADTAGVTGTRRYIERAEYTDANGQLSMKLRPNPAGFPYTVYVSRGTEYDLFQQPSVVIGPNKAASVAAKLTRVVDTTDWIAGDFHLHTMGSIDSDSPEEHQILGLAGEGIEFVASTDHNYVSDLSPAISKQGLDAYISSIVGVEMTTIEGGHFNGFPLEYEPGPVLHGSFEWSGRAPEEIFTELRSRGAYGPENVIVQINHPRDTILGYFDQYGVNNMSLEPEPEKLSVGLGAPGGPAFVQYDDLGQPLEDEDGNPISQFSLDFDAIEIFNGKRFTQIHAVRSFDPADCLTGDEVLDYLPPTQRCSPNLPPEITLPPPGVVVLEDDNTAAFPGNVEDWFNLLNSGHRIAGMANSDSHHPFGEEPGFPRTYVRTGQDDPRRVDPLGAINDIKALRLTTTNGPFVELFVNDVPIGGTAAGPNANVRVVIQAPAWVGVDTMVVYVNGIEAARRAIAIPDGETRIVERLDLELERDSFVVVEVTGRESLFPVVPPLEQPPLLLTEAVGAIGGAFGLGSGPYEALRPSEVRLATAWAMTNPVFVDFDGDGSFTALGRAIDRDGDTVPDDGDNCPDVSNISQADGNGNGTGDACEGMGGSLLFERADDARIRPVDYDHEPHIFEREPGTRRDVRAIFNLFNHGH